MSLSAEVTRSRLRAPVNLTWEITLKCNLHCVHCLSDAGSELSDELSYNQCLSLIDQIASIRVFQINMGGGEPFLRPRFIDILKYAHKKGIVTCVSTNGILINPSLARDLVELDNFYLQVSLDGATAEVNDAIRGPSTFHQIIYAMECLSLYGVPFSINTVLTRLNFPQLEMLRELAASYHADLRVSRFRPSGRGKETKTQLGPSADQLEFFAEWLARNDLVRTGDSFFCLTSENRRRKGLEMCGAAKMTACISPAGNVYPCAFLQEPPFLVGNIKYSHFKTLWDESSIFNHLRNLNSATCTDCVRFENCRGGCPAVAYHTYHDMSMPDPECLINLQNRLKKTA